MRSFLSPIRLFKAGSNYVKRVHRKRVVARLNQPQNSMVVVPLINVNGNPVRIAETFAGRHRLSK